MQKPSERPEFTTLHRKRSHKLHRKRKKQPSLLIMMESNKQLPRIYGPACMRFSPSAAKRPHTNHTHSREKPQSCKNNPVRCEAQPELETAHKVTVKQNYFRALPPIPQLSEEEPERGKPRGRSKKIYSSFAKNTATTETMGFPYDNKRSVYETDHSNHQDEELRSSADGALKPLGRGSAAKKHRRKFKTINPVSVTPSKQSVAQSLVVEGAPLHEHTQFSKVQTNERVSILRQLLTKSIRSDIFRIKLPEKLEEIDEFVRTYKPINPEVASVRDSKHFKVLPYKGLRALYFGECVEKDKRHGLGIYLCQNLLFEGRFQNDCKEFGLEVTHQGVYRGYFRSNKRNGNGQFEWYNGEAYRGEWKDNMKHGEGVWQRPNGQSYTGDWVQNTLQGVGKYVFSENHFYEGGFVNFMKDGMGHEQFANGEIYEGYYKDGLPEGKGKYCWSADEFYEGEWHKGNRQGYGAHTKGRSWRYEGQYFKDKRHGHGSLTTVQCTYTGMFQNNAFSSGTVTNTLTNSLTPYSSNIADREE